jgi:hypothetical protein
MQEALDVLASPSAGSSPSAASAVCVVLRTDKVQYMQTKERFETRGEELGDKSSPARSGQLVVS